MSPHIHNNATFRYVGSDNVTDLMRIDCAKNFSLMLCLLLADLCLHHNQVYLIPLHQLCHWLISSPSPDGLTFLDLPDTNIIAFSTTVALVSRSSFIEWHSLAKDNASQTKT